MTNEEYKQAKVYLGIRNPDIWHRSLNISIDTDKSYSSGRLEIPELVVQQIRDMKEVKDKKVSMLYEQFGSIFDERRYIVSRNPDSNDIEICKRDEGTSIATLINRGKDFFGGDFYEFIKSRSVLAVVRFGVKEEALHGQVYALSDCDWFLWRSDNLHQAGFVGYIHNYKNEVTKEVLEMVLQIII